MRAFWWGRAGAGALTALLGLVASQLVARAISTRDSPVEAIGTWIIRHAPGPWAERAIRAVGHADKPLLITGVVLVVTLVIALLATRESVLGAFVAMGVFAVLGVGAIAVQPGPNGVRPFAVVVGLGVWLVLLPTLIRLLPEPEDPAWDPTSRRTFLRAVGGLSAVAALGLLASRYVGTGRRRVEQARAALRLRGVTRPQVPAGADQGVAGQPAWQTPTSTFYRIDTALLPPAVDPDSWRLRIHGLVDHPLEFSFADLQARELTEDWVTLCCVSNTVGGDLIGNAWWSGVRIAPLLAEAGVQPGATGVLQTSADGWTCLTPLSVLTDDRNAMLALAMNGKPLPIEHGFPVRTVVPGLYGYVSATKWVVDFKVTTFDADEGYWTPLGWGAQGPIKLGSRIDVATEGGQVLAGSAWHQHTGIEAVEVSVDGGAWTRAELAREPSTDAWVQWRYRPQADAGSHRARVRAIGQDGEVQTGAMAAPAPNGASGWHSMEFEVS